MELSARRWMEQTQKVSPRWIKTALLSLLPVLLGSPEGKPPL